MKNKKLFGMKSEYLVAVLVFTAAFGVMAKVGTVRSKRAKTVKSVAPVVVPKVRRTLDGVLVERGKGKENPPIAGVMVENMIEAQPISGIADAQLVFEAVVEANITRFLAYFVLDGNIEVGPVRSARPYYLDLASEFNTLYGHVGSAPEAYDMLRKKGVPGVYDLDQWYESQYYKRVSNHPAPHNVYTSTELLRKAYALIRHPERASQRDPFGEGSRPNGRPASVGDPSSPAAPQDDKNRMGFLSWKFKNDAPPDLRGNVEDIYIEYIAPYNVQWKYDKTANQYGRIQWNGPHKDVNGKAIIAKNIAVAFQKMEVLDAVGRKKFTTIGQGKGLVFQDGRVVVGTWKKPGAKAEALAPGKPSAQERMRFYDVQGNEVEFNAGVTWVEIVPEGYGVKY